MVTIVFNKGENFHLTKTAGGYDITYKYNGNFYKRSVDSSGVAESPVLINYADESLNLSGGAKLIRTEENITVIKE